MASSIYSINYQSRGEDTERDIVLPGEGSALCQKKKKLKDEGVIITAEPSIVIKTKLVKGDSSNGSIQSILNIASGGNGQKGEGITSNVDTKIFINICSHGLISLPTKRKTIDEESGKEVDGWHLPMSMGDLRPCFDKKGNAAIVADCIMNTRVVKDMETDSNHFHFVCDLVIQCATRKFSKPSFGGLQLDKRYKVPKMKYAGYVDEKTGLPTDARMILNDIRPVVAKQRIKGKGPSKPIIEELDSTSPSESARERSAKVSENELYQLPLIPVELFLEDVNNKLITMQEFLSCNSRELLPGALRKRIETPVLKQIAPEISKGLHSCQLLSVPVPFSVNTALSSSIIARCIDVTQDVTLEVSALQLVLSSKHHSTTDCVLPFLIDSHKTKCTFNSTTNVLEIKMPLLQRAEGPDPGTKQWELINAFSHEATRVQPCTIPHMDSSAVDMQTVYFDADSDTDSTGDSGKLPEDVFHSQDALSRHYLMQQEDERNAKKESNRHILDGNGEDTELIDVKDFRPGENFYMQEQSCEDNHSKNVRLTLRKAESLLKETLQSNAIGCALDNSLALGLV